MTPCRIISVWAALAGALITALPHSADANPVGHAPDGLRVILVSIKEDPQVISYDPDVIYDTDLIAFARDLCGHSNGTFEPVPPFMLQRLRGHKRAHIFCMGKPQ